MAAANSGDLPEPGDFRLAGAVYAQREGKILILKRGGGEMTGAWYLPGGGVDRGESPEQAAVRELREEAGLTPAGPLTLIGLVPMRAYDRESVQAVYACHCPDGDVVLSHEHTGFRWIDPREYRDRYFGDDQLARVAEGEARRSAMVRGVRENLDRYLAWLDHQFEDVQLRLMGLTADVFVVRDGKILLLKRQGGVGSGSWYVPGGVVDRGEQPVDGAIREVLEETGLRIATPHLLRTWSWQAQNSRDAYHVAYAVQAPAGEVVLSDEHSAHRWITPEEYAAQMAPGIEERFPVFASWFPRVRENLAMVRSWMDGRS